jgi:hypothetical protein
MSAFDTDCSPDLLPFTPIKVRISPRVTPSGCCWMTPRTACRFSPLRALGAAVRLAGALRQCALPGFCTLRLLVGGNGGEFAFGRFEFSIDIGHLLERSVMHLVRGSNRSSDREDGTITTTYGCCTDLP